MRLILMFLVNNGWLKLLALALAAFTFYAVRGATGYEVEYTVPVEVAVEPGIAVLNIDPSTVRVRFRGSQDDLLKLDQDTIQAVVTPRGGEPDGSQQEIPITDRNIEGIGGVRVVKIDPPSVGLTFDREVETTVRVAKPRAVGTPLAGTVAIDFEPQTVKIRGPKQRIQDMKQRGKDEVATEPVDVDGRVQSFTKRVRILPPSDKWLSRIDPSEVTVKVNIVTERVTREWLDLPVRVLHEPGTARTVRVVPPTASVTLVGREDLIAPLGEDSISVLVDTAGLEQGASYELPVTVHLPCQLEVDPIVDPQTVRVTIEEAFSSL